MAEPAANGLLVSNESNLLMSSHRHADQRHAHGRSGRGGGLVNHNINQISVQNVENQEEVEREEWRRVHEAVEYAEIRERNKVRIKTNVNKKDVQVRDDYPHDNPKEKKIFKFYCPICLRYFNTVLISSCCDNYICRFCIGDMAKKAKHDPKF